MIERWRAFGLLAVTTIGCRSKAAPQRTADTFALAVADAASAAVDADATDDELRPPEWTRMAPAAEDGGGEASSVAAASSAKDVCYNDLEDGTIGEVEGSADAPPFVLRAKADAEDSVSSVLARYPFFPFRAHGLPAVSADGSTVALIDVKPSTVGHGAEFDLDLYDVAHDRLRTRVVLWSYAEEDELEDLNDSIGTATAAAKRMDGRMSRANALLRASSPSWKPLAATDSHLATGNEDGDDEETYFGTGLLVKVANGKAHVTNMHFPALRLPP